MPASTSEEVEKVKVLIPLFISLQKKLQTRLGKTANWDKEEEEDKWACDDFRYAKVLKRGECYENEGWSSAYATHGSVDPGNNTVTCIRWCIFSLSSSNNCSKLQWLLPLFKIKPPKAQSSRSLWLSRGSFVTCETETLKSKPCYSPSTRQRLSPKLFCRQWGSAGNEASTPLCVVEVPLMGHGDLAPVWSGSGTDLFLACTTTSFRALFRVWQDGISITMELEMKWEVEGCGVIMID